MICPRCNKINREDIKSCVRCGEKLYVDHMDTPEKLKPSEEALKEWKNLHTVEIDQKYINFCFFKYYISTQPIVTMAFTPSCSHLAVNGAENTFKIFDIQRGTIVKTYTDHKDRVTSLAYSPNEKLLASTSMDRTIKIRQWPQGNIIRTFFGNCGFTIVKFLSDNNTIVTANRKREINFWDIETAECLKTFKGHSREITCFAVSPDEKYLLSGSLDSDIKIWDIEKNWSRRVFGEHYYTIYSIKFHPAGTQVTSLDYLTGKGGRILLWDFETGKVLRTIRESKGELMLMDQSRNGRDIITMNEKNEVEIWNQSAGNYINNLGKHEDIITTLTFSSNGNMAASGDETGTVKIWGKGQ